MYVQLLLLLLLQHIQVFNHYGIPPSQLYRAVPKYFPASNGDNFVHNGRIYTPDEQNKILHSVQSAYYFTIASEYSYSKSTTKSRFRSRQSGIVLLLEHAYDVACDACRLRVSDCSVHCTSRLCYALFTFTTLSQIVMQFFVLCNHTRCRSW